MAIPDPREQGVVGVDEVGRGALAGPVVAVALCFAAHAPKGAFDTLKVRDSKTLSRLQRERVYAFCESADWIRWGVGSVSSLDIDRLNIRRAALLSMGTALSLLLKALPFTPRIAYIDGQDRVVSSIPQIAMPRADSAIFVCSLASIIAKVTRDRLMDKAHKEYPRYGFAAHKGYGTAPHMASLAQYGPCPIHRATFAPVALRLAHSQKS